MKLKIKVTKEILKQSMYCGSNDCARNCAISVGVREVWPHAAVTQNDITPFCYLNYNGKEDYSHLIFINDKSVRNFINEFDSLRHTPEQRLLMPELEFEVEIDPDVHLPNINFDKIISESKTLELV